MIKTSFKQKVNRKRILSKLMLMMVKYLFLSLLIKLKQQ